jgi:hypothetical protein
VTSLACQSVLDRAKITGSMGTGVNITGGPGTTLATSLNFREGHRKHANNGNQGKEGQFFQIFSLHWFIYTYVYMGINLKIIIIMIKLIFINLILINVNTVIDVIRINIFVLLLE